MTKPTIAILLCLFWMGMSRVLGYKLGRHLREEKDNPPCSSWMPMTPEAPSPSLPYPPPSTYPLPTPSEPQPESHRI